MPFCSGGGIPKRVLEEPLKESIGKTCDESIQDGAITRSNLVGILEENFEELLRGMVEYLHRIIPVEDLKYID